MISIGDFVCHQTTGQAGQVVAYGHQIKDGIYLPTLTVRLTKGKRVSDNNFIEDVSSAWALTDETGIAELSLDHSGAVAATA
ncbi:hypothetical protein K9N68_25825 [Kovacikia minuta CCNUW1]|uniref:hypothetical protein n=1 Tax=Kovacikia minuta TaxID=2931930 RepID=UPI001CD006F0|nr:hypothetical protein [Kovacikia minuta]UBF25027.1 hypothetical protein K9N68_25825 [Kovacikia minuta CCNUW1]